MNHAETALVTILMDLGMRNRRAVAFERWLDDQRPVGFSGDLLADMMLKFAEASFRELVLRQDSDKIIAAARDGQQLDLFGYGL